MPNDSRRRFVKTVLLASGAVFVGWDFQREARAEPARGFTTSSSGLRFKEAHRLLRGGTLPTFPPTHRTSDVVIVGGGAAGLAAAWQLSRQGLDVLVVENEPVIGGAARSVSMGDIQCPLGGTYFYQYGGVIKAFLDDVGYRPTETGEDAQLFSGELFTDWWNPKNISSLPIPELERASFRKFRDILLAMKPVPSYPLRDAKPDLIAEYDGISAETFVSRFSSGALSERMDLFARSVLGAPLSEVNAYSFINMYSGEFGDAYQAPCFTAAGGLSSILELAQRRIGESHVMRECLVVSVENRASDSVVVRYIEASGAPKTIEAKHAVVAIQKRIASRLVRGLSAAQQRAMEKVRYAPYVTIVLRCNAPLFKRGTFDCWLPDRAGRFTDILDISQTYSGSMPAPALSAMPNSYLLFCPRPEVEREMLQDERKLAAFAQSAVQGLADHFKGALDIIEEIHVFAFGHSMVIPHVDSHKELGPIISRPLGNIQFANSDNDLVPGFENALLAGLGTRV
jgi:phytoene dehydrogenase-like protein